MVSSYHLSFFHLLSFVFYLRTCTWNQICHFVQFSFNISIKDIAFFLIDEQKKSSWCIDSLLPSTYLWCWVFFSFSNYRWTGDTHSRLQSQLWQNDREKKWRQMFIWRTTSNNCFYHRKTFTRYIYSKVYWYFFDVIIIFYHIKNFRPLDLFLHITVYTYIRSFIIQYITITTAQMS